MPSRADLASLANAIARESRHGRSAPPLHADSSRETLTRWLMWADPNGAHTDELAAIEDIEPYTLDSAWEAVAGILELPYAAQMNPMETRRRSVRKTRSQRDAASGFTPGELRRIYAANTPEAWKKAYDDADAARTKRRDAGARENPALSGFLSTTQGKVTAALIAAGAVVGAIFVANSSSAAAPPAPAPPLPAGSPANLLFNLTTPYANTPANLAVVKADLAAAGFAPALVQRDPTTTNTWVVAATYPPTGAYNAAISLALTTTTPTATSTGSPVGPGSFQIGLTGGTAVAQASGLAVITGALPVPMSVSLTSGIWYSFSVRTSFLQSAPGAQADVISLLQGMGFGGGGTAAAPTLLVAPVTQSAPGPGNAITDPTALDTWNVVAQFTGAAGTPAGQVFTVTDGPPLLFFLPKAPPTALGATIAPGTVPSNVMP